MARQLELLCGAGWLIDWQIFRTRNQIMALPCTRGAAIAEALQGASSSQAKGRFSMVIISLESYSAALLCTLASS